MPSYDPTQYPGTAGPTYTFPGQATSGTTGSSGGGTSPSAGGWWSQNWQTVLDSFLQGASGYANYQSQQKANKTNVMLARENRDWETMMSNTAIQRRKADLIAAGGNPALAFTNGGEAATPTLSPARVDAPQFQAPRLNTGLLMMQAQLDNIKAQTYNTTQDTRMKTIQANILDKYGLANSAEDLERKAKLNNLVANQITKAAADAEISQTTASLLRDKMSAAIELIQSQARIGTINADSSEAIAKQLGVAGKDVGPVGNLIFKALQLLISSK